jgi:antitoxin MazE
MTKKIIAIGNSQGVIIDKTILELLKIPSDAELDIETDGKRIILTPVRTSARTRMKPELRAAAERAIRNHGETFRKLAK